MERVCNAIERIFSGLIFVQLAVTALVLGANITGRYLFDYSIIWSNNMARYMYIYIVLVGTAVSYKLDLHAVITVAHDAVPDKIKKIFDAVHYAAMVFLSTVLIIPGIYHVTTMWPVTDPIMPFSMGIIYISVPLSAFGLLMFVISRILRLIQGQD